jgi:hypothetical protein
MITYERYAELLSKNILARASMTPRELAQAGEFEQEQPKTCPHCRSKTWSPFQPPRIVHNIDACGKIPKA